MEIPLESQQLSKGKQVSVSFAVISMCSLSVGTGKLPPKTMYARSEGWMGRKE